MKLHADLLAHLNTVTGYGPGFIEINRIRHSGHLLLSPDQPAARWDTASFEALRAEDFAALLAHSPEVIVVGTGSRQRFPQPQLTRAIAEAQIGIEVMTTPAACRTYNILVGEGRRVVAAFLQDT